MSVAALHSLSQLRGMPVDVGDHEIGHVGALILDPSGDALVGYEVTARTGREYFLPFSLAHITLDRIRVASPLHLVDDVAHYRRRGRSLPWAEAARCVDVLTGRLVADDPLDAVTTPAAPAAPSPRAGCLSPSEAVARRASG